MSELNSGTPLIDVQLRGSAAWIVLNRQDKLNVLSREVLIGLQRAVTQVEAAGVARSIVLTGSGSRAFCAGADLKQVKSTPTHEFLGENMLGHRVFAQLRRSPLPVIAAINGAAFGGGLEMALACDLRIAVSGARFGLPEMKVGVLPGWGGTWRLAEAVGAARARELVLTGRLLGSDEAQRLGLVSDVLPDLQTLYQRTEELVDQLADNSAVAVAHAKALLNSGEDPAGVHAAAESGYVTSLLGTEHFAAATERF